MRKLLWVGDAACDSGFAVCTHNTLEALRQTWDVSVLGINYRGDPHSYPYPIYPAYVIGQQQADLFGVSRLVEIIQRVKPDLVVLQNDPWNIPAYVKRLGDYNNPPLLVGAVAVDGKNCRGTALNGLDHVVFWTKFAQEEARVGGLTKPSGVVGLGVDLEKFRSVDSKVAVRREMLPTDIVPIDSFIVLNVNRNQPRKRLDLTMEYFAEFYHKNKATDAYLYLHVCPTGDRGYNLDQLTGYYDLKNHVMLAQPGVFTASALDDVVRTYQLADVQMTTTQGEGWGLTTMEGMACGVPQVVPDWSALGEWPGDSVMKVPCSNHAVTPNGVNVIGGVPDKGAMVEALTRLYRDQEARREFRTRGLRRVERPEFRWSNIGARFAEEVDGVYRRFHEGPASDASKAPTHLYAVP